MFASTWALALILSSALYLAFRSMRRRYLLVDDESVLLVAPDASGALSQGVVTQAVPLKYITAIHESPHNPNLLQMEISDILESASATAAGRAAPPTKLMRLSFDTRDMAEECAQFVNAERERHWRQLLWHGVTRGLWRGLADGEMPDTQLIHL